MEVAINPTRFKIEGSNMLSFDERKERMKQEQATLRGEVPSDIQCLVNMETVNPSTLSQLEDAYMDKTGNLLFLDYFAYTDIRRQRIQGDIVVGRAEPNDPRYVGGWNRGGSGGHGFCVSVVVLPRKLSS